MKIQRMRIGIAVLAGLVLLPVAAKAQSPQDRVDEALMKAEEAGIPVSLLESKVNEGKAKGISMDRIAAAVEARLKGLQQAQDAIQKGGVPDPSPEELSVAADALGSGVSEAVLAELANQTGRDRRVVAIAALTQLVNQGILPESALSRVQQALSQGSQALANLGGAGSHVPEGVTPGPGSGGGSSPSTGGAPSSVPGPGTTSTPQRGGPSGRGPF